MVHVITMGFPAPEIAANPNVDAQGHHRSQFFLKSHANEGIVSATYSIGATLVYEFNVGWHHGESGGAVAALEDQPAVFTMQHYRNIQLALHGVVAGPTEAVPCQAFNKNSLRWASSGCEWAVQQRQRGTGMNWAFHPAAEYTVTRLVGPGLQKTAPVQSGRRRPRHG